MDEELRELPGVSIQLPAMPMCLARGTLQFTYFVRVATDDGTVVHENKWNGFVHETALTGTEGDIRETLRDHFQRQIAKPFESGLREFAIRRADENAAAEPVNPEFPRAPQPPSKRSDWNQPIHAGQYHPAQDMVMPLHDVHSRLPWERYRYRFPSDTRCEPAYLPLPSHKRA